MRKEKEQKQKKNELYVGKIIMIKINLLILRRLF